MTLLPGLNVRGYPGKPHKINEVCAAPDCGLRSVHGHHLWSRSHLRGQPYEWVQLEDGTVLGNRVGLCLSHHNAVTGEIGGHQARIAFDSGLFWWEVPEAPVTGAFWIRVGPLDSQPPGVNALQPTNGRAAPEECPTCGHRKSARRLPRRKSKTWTMEVPDDAEAGSDILDETVDWIAEQLGYEDERSRLRRYHAVVAVMFWTLQRREEFVSDIAESAERSRVDLSD